MDPAITAAIISGSFGLLTPITIQFLLKAFAHGRPTIPQSRRTTITGRWEGTAYQDEGPDGGPISYFVSADLLAQRKSVTGEVRVRLNVGDTTHTADLNVAGGMLYDHFLLLNYMPSDQSTVQFGAFVFELDANGKKLTGRYVGFGRLTERIISGMTELTKAS